MSTVRRVSRRRRAEPEIVGAFWAGSPPPDRPATAEEPEIVAGLVFYNEERPEGIEWKHQPHWDAWLDWAAEAAP